MSEIIIDFFASLPEELYVLVVSLFPIVELRGSIPLGAGLGMPFYTNYICSVIGNLIPIPFILLFISKFLDFLSRFKRTKPLVDWLRRKADKHSSRVLVEGTESESAELGATDSAEAAATDSVELTATEVAEATVADSAELSANKSEKALTAEGAKPTTIKSKDAVAAEGAEASVADSAELSASKSEKALTAEGAEPTTIKSKDAVAAEVAEATAADSAELSANKSEKALTAEGAEPTTIKSKDAVAAEGAELAAADSARAEKQFKSSHRAMSTAVFWALTLFVAIPLPGTGAWTGSLVAALFGLPKRKSFLAVTLGVLISGVIMCLASYGVVGFLQIFA